MAQPTLFKNVGCTTLVEALRARVAQPTYFKNVGWATLVEALRATVAQPTFVYKFGLGHSGPQRLSSVTQKLNFIRVLPPGWCHPTFS